MKSRLFPLILIAPLIVCCKAFHTHSYEVISVEVQSTPENPNIGIRTIKCMASYCGDTKREENCSVRDTAFTALNRTHDASLNISEDCMNMCRAKDSYKIGAGERNIFCFDTLKDESLISKFKTFKLCLRSNNKMVKCDKQFNQARMFDKDFKYTASSWEQIWSLGYGFLSKETYPIERLGEPFYFDLINGDNGLNPSDYWALHFGIQFYE